MTGKTIRNQSDLIAYLERRAKEEGPKSNMAVMAANARAKLENDAHQYDPNILKRQP